MNDWWLTANQFSLEPTTGGLPPINSAWSQAPWDWRPDFFFQLNTCSHSPYVTSSLTRGCVSLLQLLLVFASAIILRSILSQIRDSPNLEGQIPVFIWLRNRVALLYSQALGSIFVASYDSQGYGGGIRPRLLTEFCRSSHVASERTHGKHRFLCCCVSVTAVEMCLTHSFVVGSTARTIPNTACIVAWRHSVHDTFLCCVCMGHNLAMAVSLPLQFVLWANTP
jgi:hypothetical protein